jgi:hypothetical protein
MNWIVINTGARRLSVRVFLAIALPMTLRTFQYFPGMTYVQEGWFALCFLAVLLFYPFLKLWFGMRFSSFEIYLILLIVADVLLAAWQAHDVFGQPLIYGILAQRSVSLIAMLLVLFNALRCGLLEVTDIEAVLLFLAWGTFLLYSAMLLLLNPADFLSYGIGFVNPPINGEGASFKFQGYFITFAILYYVVKGMQTRRSKNYLAAAVLFLGTLGPTGRGYMLCVAMTLLTYLYRLKGFHKATISLAKFACAAIVLLGILYAAFPAALSARAAGFADVFAVLTGGTAGTDQTSTIQSVSANQRIFETLAALPYIQEHPLLGNGVISNQWGGGKDRLGEFFFAADIGVIGIAFSYGIIGLFLYLFQYRFAWNAARKLPPSFHTPLLDATKAFVLFTALYSLETGLCVWNAEITVFFIILLGGIATQACSSQIADGWTGTECNLQKPALSQ